MFQYLLNATAIWLISLVLFDVFLRRESYHGYNRFYLLFTFLLGALLPLWQWQDDSLLYNGALQRPVERVISAKETIVAAASPSATSFNWELYLRYAYIAGALVSLLLLIAEVVKLIRLFKAGNRYREGSCMIIETGKDYSPFSIFNCVFVSSREKYNDEEWQTIITHEQMHGLLFHFADVLLMQVARIVFWFHPLVYVYQKRLMMQHEYQADKAGKAQPQLYGKFLIEQALLQTAPSISHSFNRSPIKNRIVMLTRKSSKTAKTKMLVLMPVVLVCILCFSKNVFSQQKPKAKISISLFGRAIPKGIGGVHRTYDEASASPTLVCNDPGYTLISYKVSFLPKGMQYYGPLKQEATKMTDRAIDAIRNAYKGAAGDTTRVFIDDVMLKSKKTGEMVSAGSFLCNLTTK